MQALQIRNKNYQLLKWKWWSYGAMTVNWRSISAEQTSLWWTKYRRSLSEPNSTHGSWMVKHTWLKKLILTELKVLVKTIDNNFKYCRPAVANSWIGEHRCSIQAQQFLGELPKAGGWGGGVVLEWWSKDRQTGLWDKQTHKKKICNKNLNLFIGCLCMIYCITYTCSRAMESTKKVETSWNSHIEKISVAAQKG